METQGRLVRTILTPLAYVAAALGFLAMVVLGLLLAVWSWGLVGFLMDVPSFVQAGLTLIVWLVATAVIPLVLVVLKAMLGTWVGSIVAAVGGGFLVWSIFGMAWLTVLVGYAMGFSIWYMEKR